MAEALRAAEVWTLAVLHALGLAPEVHGQPGWPFAQRLAVETFAIDPGLGRQTLVALAATVVVLAFVGTGAVNRRLRWPAWFAAIGFAALAHWPAAGVLLADATPTAFHRSPTGFAASSIDRGLALYATHCAACHGDDGRGETAHAATLAVWPPRLDGALLWRRAEGDTFWRIAHGLRDRHGRTSMPGFAGTLDDASIWALIDGLKALAAGRSAQLDSTWARPVAAPDALVDCSDGTPPRRLASYRGQRLRLVAARPGAPPPTDDPRLVTIALRPDMDGGCAITDPAAWRAYARIAGLDAAATAGTEWLVDRDGWLRAVAPPGRQGWSAASLLCRSATATAPRVDDLGSLIAAIDADRIASGLAPHAR